MLRPNAGAARLFGEPVGDAGPRVWSRVGQLLETPFGYGELTPTENVVAAPDCMAWTSPRPAVVPRR